MTEEKKSGRGGARPNSGPPKQAIKLPLALAILLRDLAKKRGKTFEQLAVEVLENWSKTAV